MVNILKKHEIMKILPTLVILPSSESGKFRGSRGIGGLVPSCPRACYVGPQFSLVGISWVPNFFPVGPECFSCGFHEVPKLFKGMSLVQMLN